MQKYSTAFGMDVHLRSTTVCALVADTGEAVTRRFPGNPWGEIAGWMDGFPGVARGLREQLPRLRPAEELAEARLECVVAAVSKIPRSAADSGGLKNGRDEPPDGQAILAHGIPPHGSPPGVEGIRDSCRAYDGATARWRPPSSGCSPSSQGSSSTTAPRPPATRGLLDLRLPEVAH